MLINWLGYTHDPQLKKINRKYEVKTDSNGSIKSMSTIKNKVVNFLYVIKK